MALVKGGEEVVVTERSVPIARLSPLDERDLTSSRLRELIRAGLLRPPRGRLPKDFMSAAMPRDPEGSLLEAVLQEQSEGW